MELWLQHLVVFILVGASAAAVAWQAIRALAGRKTGCGTCHGCSTQQPRPSAQRIVFVPAELLRRKR